MENQKQIITALDWFNNQLDEILEIYPNEWIKIQAIFEEAKKRENEEHSIILKNGKEDGYIKYSAEKYL